MTREERIAHWVELSDRDCAAMHSLFENGHYVWSLFIGHLVVEKLLKAYYVGNVDCLAPRTHNLLKVALDASLELSEDRKSLLDELTAFNIRSRYPDIQDRFHRTATRKFTAGYIEQITEFREWLLRKVAE